MQPGSGDAARAGVGVQREADPTLGLDAEPDPAESLPKSNFPFLGYGNPNVVLPGLGDRGVCSTAKHLDHLLQTMVEELSAGGWTLPVPFSSTAESRAAGGAQRIAREGKISKKDFGNVL